MSDFQGFNLSPAIMRALEVMAFKTPTPIQQKAIPVGLAGSDLVGCAQTGTGKTAAFCIPLLTAMLAAPQKNALILAPTRELVLQIEKMWRELARFTPQIACATVIGGASMGNQIRALSRKPRLIVATPGRLVDHLQRRTVNLSAIGYLVLDEADRMLDMGFEPQLTRIMSHVPKARQTLLFTATWEPRMDKLAARYLRNPTRVTVGEMSRAASTVTQSLISTTVPAKNETLLDELNAREGSVLVFARTKSRTDRVARYLASYGVDVNRIHGGRTQGQRNSALAQFRSGEVRVLVATDIAARGLDISEIAHVINYDLPQQAEDYVHRIGRTGRAGATGTAVSFVTPEDRGQWNEIARLLKKTGSSVPMPAARPAQCSTKVAPVRVGPYTPRAP
jgi:superfamily II DNA/RNA helicase